MLPHMEKKVAKGLPCREKVAKRPPNQEKNLAKSPPHSEQFLFDFLGRGTSVYPSPPEGAHVYRTDL